MKLPVSETFYSLKGEGKWTGTPMFFIRLADCNLHCAYCDTDYSMKQELSIEDLCDLAISYATNRIVITGGEPMLHSDAIEQLTKHFNRAYRLLNRDRPIFHLESNGTLPIPYGIFEWIALSPKSPPETLSPEALSQADEVKFLVGQTGWEEQIEEVSPLCRFSDLFVMPLAKPFPFRDASSLMDENTKLAIQYCLDHPNFSLCLQVHKYLDIK